MADPFVTDRGARVLRNPWVMGLAAMPYLLAVGAILSAAVTHMPQFLFGLPHLLIFGTVFSIVAWLRNPWHRERPGQIRADSRGVAYAGELVAPRERIKDGFVMPRPDGTWMVRLRMKGARMPVDLRVSDRDEGRSILRALGLDASQSVAEFRLPSVAFANNPKRNWFLVGFAAGMMGLAVGGAFATRLFPAIAPFMPIALAVFALSAVVLVAIPTRFKVGADGLNLAWMRRSRFIGYGDIDRIDPYEDEGFSNNRFAGLVLVLKSGEKVHLPIVAKRSTLRDAIYIIHERISEAIDTWARGEGTAHAAQIRRSGRDTSEWVRALRGIGALANVDARTAPVLPEKLWRIVEDPAAPADARAGAAVALGRSIDEEGRSRLRAAASTTAAPKLRIAIEKAAGDADDEALTAALAEVEADADRSEKKA